jgi:hypothetical protein
VGARIHLSFESPRWASKLTAPDELCVGEEGSVLTGRWIFASAASFCTIRLTARSVKCRPARHLANIPIDMEWRWRMIAIIEGGMIRFVFSTRRAHREMRYSPIFGQRNGLAKRQDGLGFVRFMRPSHHAFSERV